MDLAAAVAVAGTTARMPVRQDAERLLRHVTGRGAVPPGKALSLAWLPPGVEVRPVEALHLLSLVTAHAYSAGDLHDAYAWWGLLRYLGFFDHEPGKPDPVLRVSRAGAQVAGVQRRVASEELGIAFGVLLASMHVRKALGPGVPVGIVDVDVLLRGSGAGSSGRADYVLVAGPDEDEPAGRVYFLECKGTSDPQDCGRQLAKAVGQVAGRVLGYAARAGLAASTVAGVSQVSCLVLELADGDAGPSGRRPRSVLRDDLTQGTLPGLADDLVRDALRASWSVLGRYAGNEAAARRWPDEDRKTYTASSRARPGRRVEIDSRYGPAIGISAPFDLGDRQLVVTWAIGQQVDDALTSGDFQDVRTAQEAFAAELDGTSTRESQGDELDAPAETPEPEGQVTAGEPVESAMPDGSIFSLTVR